MPWIKVTFSLRKIKLRITVTTGYKAVKGTSIDALVFDRVKKNKIVPRTPKIATILTDKIY